VTVGLSACASAPVVTTPKPGEGSLVVKVIGVQPLSPFAAKWTSLRVKNKLTGGSITLTDQSPAWASYSLFAANLPSGQYEITEFSSTGAAPEVAGVIGLLPALAITAMTSESQRPQGELGTFAVAANALCNLGVIVSSLPPNAGGAPIIAVLADNNARRSAFESIQVEQQSSLGQLPVGGGWDVPLAADANARALDLVRRYSQNIAALETVPAGNRLLIGGLLGVIHTKSEKSPWTSISTGTFDAITAIAVLDDGSIVAGSDSGRMLFQGKDGSWRARSLPDSRYRVTRIVPLGGKGLAFVAVNQDFRSPFAVVFFQPQLDGSGQLVEWMKYDSPTAAGRYPAYFDGIDFVSYFSHPGLARKADVHRINVTSQTQSVSTVDFWVWDVYRLPDGTLVISRENGLSVYSSFSRDGGKTWLHPDVEVPHSLRYRDSQIGFGFKTQSRGWSINTVALFKTADGGRSWSAVGSPLEGVGIMPIRYLGDSLYVFTGEKLVSSADEGRTWQIEWPQPNLATVGAN
jgi:hypothetical protein